MTDTPSGLPLMDFPQLNGEFKVNEIAWNIELFRSGITDRDLSSPPGSPATGAAYIVSGTGSGDWLDHDGDFAQWRDSAWHFTTPVEGNIIRINDEDIVVHFNGTTWATV